MKLWKHVIKSQRWILAFVFIAGVCSAAPRVDDHEFSMIVGTVGVTADVASSWSKPERTLLYRSSNGQFGRQGALLRFGIWGGSVIAQKVLRKKLAPDHKLIRVLTVLNFTAGARGGIQAQRNWR